MKRIHAWVMTAIVALCASAHAAPAEPEPASTGPASTGVVASAARYSRADAASEYWDFTARFESDHRLFARFLITNEGPGRHSAVALGHIVFPDGRVVRFRNGKREGDWELSEDRLRIRIGSSILDQTGPLAKLEHDSNKRGVKIHLYYEPDGAAPKKPPAPATTRGFELLDSDAPVHGTLWVRGMDAPIEVSGVLAATHAWLEETESKRTLRRIEFFTLEDDLSIYLSDTTTPAGVRSRWLVVERQGEVIHATDRFELALEESGAGDDAYPVPAILRFSSDALEGRIELGSVVHQHDPFEVLPQPFRFLLSFKARPYRVWADSPFEVTLRGTLQGDDDRTPLQFRGSGIINVTFLNPVPKQPGA